MPFRHQVCNCSDFYEQEDFISQLKQEKQKLKDGEHACMHSVVLQQKTVFQVNGFKQKKLK